MLRRTLSILFSPITMGVTLVLLFYFAATTAAHQVAGLAASLLVWFRLSWLVKHRNPQFKLGYWLVGIEKIRNHLGFTGMLFTRMLEQRDKPLEYPALEITVSAHPDRLDLWNIRFRNKGWKIIGPVVVGHAELLDLIAPGIKQLGDPERSVLFGKKAPSDLVPEIKTASIFPLQSRTASLPRIPGYSPKPRNVIAYFHVPGELTACRYSIAVQIR